MSASSEITTTEHERKALKAFQSITYIEFFTFSKDYLPSLLHRNWVVLNKGDEDSFTVPLILCFGKQYWWKFGIFPVELFKTFGQQIPLDCSVLALFCRRFVCHRDSGHELRYSPSVQTREGCELRSASLQCRHLKQSLQGGRVSRGG